MQITKKISLTGVSPREKEREREKVENVREREKEKEKDWNGEREWRRESERERERLRKRERKKEREREREKERESNKIYRRKSLRSSNNEAQYISTPTFHLGQGVTEGHFLSWVQLVWIQDFHSHWLVALSTLKWPGSISTKHSNIYILCARGVTVNVVGNRYDDRSSNLEKDSLNFT